MRNSLTPQTSLQLKAVVTAQWGLVDTGPGMGYQSASLKHTLDGQTPWRLTI